MIDKANKPKHLLTALLSIAIVILLVYISSFTFKRFDLTQEKRHSLTETTKEILKELKEPVFFKVYLKGDYPAEYKRLEKGIREKLSEMKAYAGDNLEYEFINPSESNDVEKTKKTYKNLTEAGLSYTSLMFGTKDGGKVEKILFPGAIVTYKGKSRALQILKSNSRMPDLVMINNSINNLEYEFARIINEILRDKKPTIAFTHGHGESSPYETADAFNALSEAYNVTRIKLSGKLDDLSEMLDDTVRYRQNKYDMIVISNPDSAFTDQEKFLLDQYLVRGGKIMLFMDPMEVNLDSLRKNQETLGLARDLNLSDMIYDHGIRFEKNILIDRNCAIIELESGQTGTQATRKQYPWYYSPILMTNSSHPIVSNIDPVLTRFTSSLTVIDKPYLEETVLLESSDYCKALKQPVRINAGIVGVNIDFTKNNSPHLPIAAMVEGKFQSAYIDRLPPEFLSSVQLAFVEKSIYNGGLLVVSDGDFIANRVSPRGEIYPLGYDRYAKGVIYGNKDFLMNAANYMLNDESFISLRSRSITLRPLNADYITKNRAKIQLTNMAVPVIFVIILGIILGVIRKRKFAKKI